MFISNTKAYLFHVNNCSFCYFTFNCFTATPFNEYYVENYCAKKSMSILN